MSPELNEALHVSPTGRRAVGCCARCFKDSRLKSIIGRRGSAGDCDYCGAMDVRVIEPAELNDFFEPLIRPYQQVEEGTHFIAALDEEADGQPLDELLDEDNPGLFSEHLTSEQRQSLVQDLINAIDGYDPREGFYRSVGDFWTRPGNEIWAGAEEEYFRSAPARWTRFVEEIVGHRRFIRDDPPADHDPASWLTGAALTSLTRRLQTRTRLFRAVIGGARRETDGELMPHPPERLSGPKPEHCRTGGRVNPPGIPVLYTSTSIKTAIAEVRPWIGGPVSVATMRPIRPLRLVDLSPRRTGKKVAGVTPDVLDIIETIGARMAEPIDPAASEIHYVPTQYVAELIRVAGYDGIRVQSALGKGRNVILFNTDDARVEDVHLYRVNRVTYEAILQDPPTDCDF